ncbi:MAG: hypothetical protein IKC03_01625 [Oscillospiraceae bacterium]|nr:hypothetical protein [Oscillospiraceae bacterium]
MRKIRAWLLERFFPAVAKEEIAALRRELEKKDAEIDRLNSYIDGFWDGARLQRRSAMR